MVIATPPAPVVAAEIHALEPRGSVVSCRRSAGGSVYCTIHYRDACAYLEVRGHAVVRISTCSIWNRPLQRYAPESGPAA